MTTLQTPYYLVYESRLRRNLDLITSVAKSADVEIIMAFKANALWKTFNILREYSVKSTASSLNEMQLGVEELHSRTHTYCPAYTDLTIDKYIAGSSHITFNSVQQFERFKSKIDTHNSANPTQTVSCGLRINPECSVIDTDIYNPCSPGSRFGVIADNLEVLPDGIDGFHFHALCESSSYDLEQVLTAVESKFGKYLPQLKWINMGGGHLMTKAGYDTAHLIKLLKAFKAKYPNLHVILEPGSAFTWQTGDLISTIVDVVNNHGINTAIVDVSFACHMPDCLEMPYKPKVTGAEDDESTAEGLHRYRIGGNSCLSGDFVGDWLFKDELKAGEQITFEDMNHYTTVKTNMFNGIQHPSIALQHLNGETEILRTYTYDDYKSRMS